MKLFIEILISVILHPIAMILMWINVIGRSDLTGLQKTAWFLAGLLFGCWGRYCICWSPTVRSGSRREAHGRLLERRTRTKVEYLLGGRMAELVDALDLGSSGETRQSSSLCSPTSPADAEVAQW